MTDWAVEKDKEIERLREENASYRDEVRDDDIEISRLRFELQNFVDRCDRGEIRSNRTYNRFKELLGEKR